MKIVVPGYEHLRVNGTSALVTAESADALRDILERGTLYEYAAAQRGATRFHGRGPVYAVPLRDGGPLVAVRHALRGGAIARFVKDRFFPPTRVLREVINSVRLQLSGVRTPGVVAAVTYPAGWILRRADVATRLVEGGADLAAIFGDARNDAQRGPLLESVATLLTSLAHAGAQHQDLNLKNILITATESGYAAYILDVDRIRFNLGDEPLVARANFDRLARSLRKWHAARRTGRGVTEDDIAQLARLSSHTRLA